MLTLLGRNFLYKVGDRIEVTVWRGGKLMTVEITLGERPPDTTAV